MKFVNLPISALLRQLSCSPDFFVETEVPKIKGKSGVHKTQ